MLFLFEFRSAFFSTVFEATDAVAEAPATSNAPAAIVAAPEDIPPIMSPASARAGTAAPQEATVRAAAATAKAAIATPVKNLAPRGPISHRIAHIDRVIEAVSKHVSAMNAANLPNSVIHTNKSPELRVIISAVEIIKAGFGIVIIPPVAEGVFVAHGVAGGVGDGTLAPGVVAVGGNDLAGGGPDDGNDIPLQVVEVVEQHGPVGKAHALAGAVVEEPHDRIPGLLRQNLAAVEEKFRGGAVHRFGRSDAVMIISRNLS